MDNSIFAKSYEGIIDGCLAYLFEINETLKNSQSKEDTEFWTTIKKHLTFLLESAQDSKDNMLGFEESMVKLGVYAYNKGDIKKGN